MMSGNSSLTLTQKQARIGVYAALFILAAVYFFEFSGNDLNKKGITRDITGKITHCSASRTNKADESSIKKGFYLFITSTGDRAYRYEKPPEFRQAVLQACEDKAEVKITYRSYQPLIYDWTGYSILGLSNNKNDEIYFTEHDYSAWKEKNKFIAIIVAIVTTLGLIYLLLVWFGFIRNRDSNEVKNNIGYRLENDDALIIKSSERNGDSWAFLILFSGLSLWFIYEAFKGNQPGWMIFLAAVMLLATYAYLVEVVNSNYLVIDDGYLITKASPLPWFANPVVIALEDIDYFIGREDLYSSSQGQLIHYAVTVQLTGEDEELHLFYAKDLAEAEAVAELANEKLTQKE